MKLSFRRFRDPRAFSMLEMLTVILVIAVLFSIAFPVLTRAVERAHWSKVPGQMKGILNGFHDYALEHNEYFPPAAYQTDEANRLTEENWEGDGLWLDSTIYAQVYPERSAAADVIDPDKAQRMADAGIDSNTAQNDGEDNTTKEATGGDGSHLEGTVFLVQHSVDKARAEEDYDPYDHSFCLNRSLWAGHENDEWEYLPRKRTLFQHQARTLLIIEGTKGDNNSVTDGDIDQIEEAAEQRYTGRFVFAGYMDGSATKIQLDDIPESRDSEEGCHFWAGISYSELQAYRENDGNLPDY